MNKMLYLDMDGLLCDLDSGLERMSGTTMPRVNSEAWFDKHLPSCVKKGLFEHLEPLEVGTYIINTISKWDDIDIAVLTSNGLYYEPLCDIVYQKKLWLERHFNGFLKTKPFITVSRFSDKVKFSFENTFLLDDRVSIIREFNTGKGKAFLIDKDTSFSDIDKILVDILNH